MEMIENNETYNVFDVNKIIRNGIARAPGESVQTTFADRFFQGFG